MGSRVFERVICPAVSFKNREKKFKIKIEFREDGELSLCGAFGNSGGQISDLLSDSSLVPCTGYTELDIVRIREYWERWHLNHMRAGTPSQENFLRKLDVRPKNYEEACAILEKANLLYDNGYKYGSSWLKEEVPEEVIKYLFTLPNAKGDDWRDISYEEVDEAELFNVLGL